MWTETFGLSRRQSSQRPRDGHERVEQPSNLRRQALSTLHEGLKKGEQNGPDLQLQGQDIAPSEHIKLLGVTLDSKMKFHQHVARMTAKATRQCLAIKRLRGVRPKQVRQLYNATVTPIMDYCASAWYGAGKWGTLTLLRNMEKVQRIGAQAIILSFRATALTVKPRQVSKARSPGYRER
jgi:hypothetical protein